MSVNELELIDNLRSIAGVGSLGLADDCAILGEYVITKDLLAENVHFFKDDAPYNLARKAVRVNLSDIAAMCAAPIGILIGACFSKAINNQWIAEFNKGLKADIDEFGFQLLGGDTVFHAAPTVISITAIGKSAKPILRSGAKLGDNIFISGALGASYLGLQARLRGEESEFSKRYELPFPRLELGLQIKDIANSCMDISDGLLLDLSRLCKASNIGAELYSKNIPLADSSYPLLELISGGDDYELLFTSKEEEVSGCYKIGKITQGEGILLDGETVEPKGYVHK